MYCKNSLFIVLFIFSTFVTSCTNNFQKEYNELKKKNLKGNELFQEVINFEVEHSSHFESKVDLSDFYF